MDADSSLYPDVQHTLTLYTKRVITEGSENQKGSPPVIDDNIEI